MNQDSTEMKQDEYLKARQTLKTEQQKSNSLTPVISVLGLEIKGNAIYYMY